MNRVKPIDIALLTELFASPPPPLYRPNDACKERGHSCSMPPGIEARSHACQRRFGRQRQSGSPIPPHPSPLPKGEGELSAAWQQNEASRHLARRLTEHPLLWGEGWGEGETGLTPFPPCQEFGLYVRACLELAAVGQCIFSRNSAKHKALVRIVFSEIGNLECRSPACGGRQKSGVGRTQHS